MGTDSRTTTESDAPEGTLASTTAAPTDSAVTKTPATDLKRIWTIHNKRYDVCSFVDQHPGGRTAILLGKGRNCTELFESYHSLTEKPHQLLKKFYVGEALKGDPDFDEDWDWGNTPFYNKLKCEVKAYFSGKSHKAGLEKWLWLGTICSLLVFSFVSWKQGNWWSLVQIPILYWLGPSSMMHDGAHFSLAKTPLINKICSYFGCAHMSVTSWYHQHVIGHHTKTNMPKKDPDHIHFRISSSIPGLYGFRVCVQDRWKSRYLDWRRGIAVRSLVSTLGPSYIQDGFSMLEKKFNRIVPYIEMTKKRVAWHFFGRMIIFYMALVFPFSAFPIYKALPFALVPYILHGIIFYIFSQVSHINDDCFHEKHAHSPEWAVHQVTHSHDYSQQSKLWGYLSNSLNNQTVHHLFPQVDSGHYPQLQPILQRTCAEFNIPYNSSVGIADALRKHVKYICRINEVYTQTDVVQNSAAK